MLSTLFTSVADALISYAIDKLNPAESIKSWLKLDPTNLAFQKALARAYSAFARQYPEYTSSLFDQSFLSTDALPELSKLLTRNQHPDPALLALAWGESIGADAEFSKSATKPASDFLLWLEAELKGEPAFQPLFDSRALDNIETGIEKLTQELQRGLDAALKSAIGYQIHVGGSVGGNIIIGDNNVVNSYYYTGDFISLNEYYIPPDGVFQRVDVDKFVGRDWLTAKVDAFLNDQHGKSGAFLLIGDAGVGKTSFMAHLVKERRYLHLFAEQAPGQAMLQRAMQSLGSQLVTRYQIDPYKDRDTLNALSVFPDFLERILRLAASTLTEGEKIVIVCDALDEAGTFPDHFVFGLPKDLPDGVYFILSQRPVNVKLPNFEPVIEQLEAQGEGNLQDIGAYLSAVAKRPEVAGQIRSREYSEDFFIQTLKEKSQGVWMYLHYIIKEIESGARAPLGLANLPTGLVGYYAEYWEAWRTGKRGKGEEAWDELYAPLLTTLAAAQEAITVAQLTQWAGVTVTPREVTRLLSEAWRAFITEKEVNGQKAFTPYHLSFKDFITGRMNTDKLPPAQANLVKDLASQTVDAHKRIVNTFEKECNGEWKKLVEQNYPRLHLSAHLADAGQYEKLITMLTEGDEHINWAEARYKKEETYVGYLSDLTHVWNYAKQQEDYALAIRCMLIENSIHSLASNILPMLLVQLGKVGLWSYARCLATIRENPSSIAQQQTLRLIVPDLPPLLLQEAFATACEIKEEYNCARTLSALAPYLNDELKAQALQTGFEVACSLRDEYARAFAFGALAPHLMDELKAQAFEAACAITNESARAIALEALAPHLTDELKVQALQAGIEAARAITNESVRARAFGAFAPHLTNELKAQALQAGLEAARAIRDESNRASALGALAPHLTDELKAQALQAGLEAARAIPDEYSRTRALSDLTPYLNDELKAQALQTGFEVACSLRDEYDRARALGALAPHLTGELKIQALEAARAIANESDRARALVALVPYLTDELKAQALQAGLEAAHTIRDESNRARALVALVPHLTDELKAQALQAGFEAAHAITNESARAIALEALAPHLTDELKAQALQAGLEAAHTIRDESARASALGVLAPHLTDELKAQALEMARAFTNEFTCAYALKVIAPYLTDELKAQALEMARAFTNESARALALVALTPHLTDELKAQAFEAAYAIQDEFSRARALKVLAPHLNNELKAQAFEATRFIRDEYDRARALEALAPHLTDELKAQALQTGLEAAYAIQDESDRVSALGALAPHLTDELKAQALQAGLEAARAIRDESDRARALGALAPHLTNELKAQAFEATRFIRDESARARALGALAPHLTDKLKAQALQIGLEATYAIQDEFSRSGALGALAPHLTDELKVHAFEAACAIQNEYLRARALVALAPHLTGELKAQAFEEALYFLIGDLLSEVLNAWKEIEFKGLKEYIIPFIKFISQKDRKTGVEVVGSLTPALVHFRGPDIAPELFRAIVDTARWWP